MPQSNQRGIETREGHKPSKAHCRPPQSNQRGIETHQPSLRRPGENPPQSNLGLKLG